MHEITKRIDKPFYDMLLASTGLKIEFTQVNYAAIEGPGGPGEVKPLVGVPPVSRFKASCPQLPELGFTKSSLELVEYVTYLHLIRTVRFCAVVDGVEVFGSATALRDLGFFKDGTELRVTVGKYDGSAFIRMEPVVESNGRDNVPYHRFFARHLSDLPKVHDILKTKGKIKEISFLPDSFGILLHEDAFLRTKRLPNP